VVRRVVCFVEPIAKKLLMHKNQAVTLMEEHKKMSILEKTVKIRHKAAFGFMGLVAPKLKTDLLQAKELLRDIPRPFTKMLREYYGGEPLVGCEIGYGLGENAENLLSELNIKKLYSVDPFYMTGAYVELGEKIDWYLNPDKRSLDRFGKLKASGKVEFIQATSDAAFESGKIPRDLDFVYIDGNHELAYCTRDIVNGLEHVKMGGFVGGHDFANSRYEVAEAVFKFAKRADLVPFMRYPDFWFKKPLDRARL
jgi:hypothetical protein